MADPNMYARLGAVAELRARLASDNLPAAVGAYEALAELAHTDVRYVADPAAAALSEAAVQPARTEVQFGRVEQGSAPSHQVVQLLGPPVARACVPRPSSDWIRVDQTAEGLDIWIDTGSAGTLLGSLDLKGPTGEAVIVIEIDIVSPAPEAAASGPGGPALGEAAAAVPVDVQPGAPPASAGPSPSSAADALPPSGAYVSPAEDTSPADAASPDDAPPQDASEPVRPATDLPDTGSEPATPEPGPHGSQDRPGTASEPSAESVPAGPGRVCRARIRRYPAPGRWPGARQENCRGQPPRADRYCARGGRLRGSWRPALSRGITAVLTVASYSGLWHTVIAAAVLGLLISVFERPLQQLEPFLHGWISLWFIIYAILILTAPHTRSSFITLLVIGAVSSAVFAAFAFMRIAWAGSSASNVIPAIAIVLMTISLVIVTLAVAQTSGGLGLLHAAGTLPGSFSSLLHWRVWRKPW